MGDGTVLGCLVLTDRDIGLSKKMGVDVASAVMTGKNGLKGNNAILVGFLDAAEEGSVQTTLTGLNTTVVAGCIAVPDIDKQLGYRLTGSDIDILDLEVQVDTWLALLDVLADELAIDVVGTISDLWRKNA